MRRCQAACFVLISFFVCSVEAQDATNTTAAPTTTTEEIATTTQEIVTTAAPATTVLTDTTAAPSVNVLVLRLIVKGVDYSALSANWALMISFKAKMKEVIMEGRDLPEGSVSIGLAAGSVIVTATIHPRPGTENTLLADVAQIAAQAVSKVIALPNIISVANGAIAVEVLGAEAKPVAPKPVTPVAPTTEVAHGSMLNPVLAVQEAKPAAANNVVRLSELLEGVSAPWVRTHAWQVAGAVTGAVLFSFATIAFLVRGSSHEADGQQQPLFPGEEQELE